MQATLSNIIVNLASEGFLKITGPDAKKLLQGQLTCDLETITPTHSSLAGLCNPQGRLISLFRLFMVEEAYYLQMPKNLLPITLSRLQKYAVFYKVTLQDESNLLRKLGLINPETTPPLTLPQNVNEVSYHQGITAIRLPDPLPRYELIGQINTMTTLEKNLSEWTALGDENQWKYRNICTNIPTVYAETSEKFLPHDLQLHKLDAISFEKGCYTGQEIIARMQYLGKSKNALFRAKAETKQLPAPGTAIYTETGASGAIVDCCQIDYNTLEMLIMAPESKAESLFLDTARTIALTISKG